jgi:hypothetical protein
LALQIDGTHLPAEKKTRQFAQIDGIHLPEPKKRPAGFPAGLLD